MEFKTIVEELAGTPNDLDSFIKTSANHVSEQIRSGQLKIIDIIKGLNAILTNSSYTIRSRGVELLAQVVIALPSAHLTEKEIEVLTEFICLRLIDHKSMEGASIRCLSYFVDCDHKPVKYNKQVMEFIKTKANIHKMDAKSRYKIYELLKKFIVEKKKLTNSMSGEFIYSFVTILEGENNPDNLMLCFGMISFILKNFDDLEAYIDDIFEWLGSYYPVDYTPIIDRDRAAGESASFVIHRSDLVDALYECFYASDLNADNLQTLLLEKVDSNVLSSQLESLECLVKCYEKPFPLASITKFNSTLWTAIRMNCLKKIDSLDPKLLEASLKTLTALTRRLLEDKELYLNFITDMYDELSIAFRKPEMDLFEPAARLLTHSILPSLVGFNQILHRLLPISLNALNANEMRPLSGLVYIFNKLQSEHPLAKLQSELIPNITKLAQKVADLTRTQQDPNCIALLEALIRQQVTLDSESLTNIVDTLESQYGKSDLDVEKCLALVCSNYNKFSIITDQDLEKYDLESLLGLINRFSGDNTDLKKFSIYLRLVKLEVVGSKGVDLSSLNQMILEDFLKSLRQLLLKITANQNIVEKSAFIHAVFANKLQEKRASAICMSMFSSDYCQKLIPEAASEKDRHIVQTVYLPHIKWIFKAMVLRNHELATPLINLVLNCVTSDKVDQTIAYDAAKTFNFVLEKDDLLTDGCHYQVFSLYKQKFYMQSSKEIRLRLERQTGKDDIKKSLLIFAIASQLVNLPLAVFKRDHEWLVRQLLRFLSTSSGVPTSEHITDSNQKHVSLIHDIYRCLECLICKDLCDDALLSFLPSIIELNLKNAQHGSSVEMRRQALICLAKVAVSFKDSDLLVYRNSTIDKLRACLTDKKRLVRQAAGEARLRWVLIGQPVGGT